MILEKQDAVYAATKLMEYFKDFNRIDDYFRARKIERVKNIPVALPGFSMEDDLFQDYDVHPEDMDFKIAQIPNEKFDTLLEMIASFTPEESPGKTMKLVVMETNTNKIVGFIRLGSPLINSKPRNDWLGGVPDLEIFNQRAVMSMGVVPVQPAFGFNMLGLKALAMLCCSHEIRRMFNDKYNIDLAVSETTSLFGSIKKVSAYDGLKPWLKYLGDTQSKFLLTLGDEIYLELKEWFTEKNGGQDLIHKGASSKKLKWQTKAVGIVKSSLKKHDEKAYQLFCDKMQTAGEITTQKRFFVSTMGWSNSKDVLLGKTEKLEKAENFDRYSMEAIMLKWKKMAGKRYSNLIADGRVRKELEVWNQDTMNKIDIIR